MKTLNNLIKSYGEYHQKTITKITHLIGVPLIVFATILLCSWISINFFNEISLPLSWLLIGTISIYYCKLHLPYGIILSIIFIIFAYIDNQYLQNINAINWLIFATLFINGWIIQLIGHIFEGKKPAFLDNLHQMLVAPLFLLAEMNHREHKH